MRHTRSQGFGIVGLVMLLSLLLGGGFHSEAAMPEKSSPAPQFQAARDKEIQQVKPRKPVRVKLHRNAKGEYSWDLTGDNVDEVVRADKRLKRLLNIE